MTQTNARRARHRGQVERLPSGALRVKVYAGIDPLTKKRNYLTETIPPETPNAEREAEKVRTRLLNEVDERRNPRTTATVNQLMDRYLKVMSVADTTRSSYTRTVNKHIRPRLGKLAVGRLDAETLDSFYALLAVCREHCNGRKYIEHRKQGEHECTDKCRPHACRPLAASSIREIHWILSGALKRAKRWRWIAVNPAEQAEPPAMPHPKPRPPSPSAAAQLLNEAWTADPDWGMFVWLAMTTGARRGELCALRWSDLDLEVGVLSVERSIAKVDGKLIEKDTKTHQHRRIALDPDTIDLLTGHRERWGDRLRLLGVKLTPPCRIFSIAADASEPLDPGTLTHRYRRLAEKLNIDTSLKSLRHYSATELITAGVDIRTVAGRLGHGGGGTTTLRVYAAWVSEADQRASLAVTGRMVRPDGATGVPAQRTAAESDEVVAGERVSAARRHGGAEPSAAVVSPRSETAKPLPRKKRKSPANSGSLKARSHWDAERAAGRTPSGIDLARVAAVDSSLGRRWRRQWLAEVGE